MAFIQKQQKTLLLACLGLLAGNITVTQAWGQNLNWHPFGEALAMADTTSRPILVNVQAPWCGWCRKMKKEVYPALDAILSRHFILTHLNRDDHSTTYRYRGTERTALRLVRRFRVQRIPAIVILNPDGKYLTHLSGFVEPTILKPILQYIASNTYRYQSFEQFKKRQSFSPNYSRK